MENFNTITINSTHYYLIDCRAGKLLVDAGSEDSISLVFDSEAAFIGDLPLLDYSAPENYEVTRASWEKLIDRKVKMFYHSHTNPIPAAETQGLLHK